MYGVNKDGVIRIFMFFLFSFLSYFMSCVTYVIYLLKKTHCELKFALNAGDGSPYTEVKFYPELKCQAG